MCFSSTHFPPLGFGFFSQDPSEGSSLFPNYLGKLESADFADVTERSQDLRVHNSFFVRREPHLRRPGQNLCAGRRRVHTTRKKWQMPTLSWRSSKAIGITSWRGSSRGPGFRRQLRSERAQGGSCGGNFQTGQLHLPCAIVVIFTTPLLRQRYGAARRSRTASRSLRPRR